MDIKIREINSQIYLTTTIFVIFLFLCFLLFIFSKLMIELIRNATFVTYTLCFKFVLSLIDPILGLDSMPLI